MSSHPLRDNTKMTGEEVRPGLSCCERAASKWVCRRYLIHVPRCGREATVEAVAEVAVTDRFGVSAA